MAICRVLFLCCVLAVSMLPSQAVMADTIMVTTTADELDSDGYCSLREAIIAANTDMAYNGCTAGSGHDTIVLGAGEYILSITGAGEDASLTGDLDILNSVSIDGGGLAIINAAGIDRVFHSIGPSTSTFIGLTIKGGSLTGDGGMSIADGGGIYVDMGGTASISNSTIRDNSADWGGGIFVSIAGTAIITGSTISNNIAAYSAGGVYFSEMGTVFITNSTISGNSTTRHGGGVLISSGCSATIMNSTITENSTTDYGGGIYISMFSTITIGSTILSGNNDESPTPNCYIEPMHTSFTSLGYNITSVGDIFSFECPFSGTGDQIGIDPLLGPLADNGGPTLTHALLPGSPAIDTGDPACPGGTDQRGKPRPADGDGDGTMRCDIGAYEHQRPGISISSESVEFGKINRSGFIENTITLTSSGQGTLLIGNVAGLDPLEAPFSIINDTCSGERLENGQSCDITVRYEPSTLLTVAGGIGGLGLLMLGMAMTAGGTRRRKAFAVLLIAACMALVILASCGDVPVLFPESGSFTDTFNIPSNDPDTPNITINVSGSF